MPCGPRLQRPLPASGSRMPLLGPLLFSVLVHLCPASAPDGPAYWGTGWEDPVSKQRLYKALPVHMDDVSSVAYDGMEDTFYDTFDWRLFEAGGGQILVRGEEAWAPQPLQSWSPRHDAVKHGHYMMYRFDDDVTTLDGTMEDHFFSVTLDVNVHPDYEASLAAGVAVNSSVRLTLYEEMPADLGMDGVVLPMINVYHLYRKELTGGNSWDLDTRRHRLTWGLNTNAIGSFEVGTNCSRPVRRIYLGVQCLAGFAFPPGAARTATTCTQDPTQRPTFNDCEAYCPFTLTVRAIPRTLTAGVDVTTYIGPGQWQTFALDVGAYDLLDVTIDRAEFDNVTYADAAWRDGFVGWLSRDTCIQGANLSEIDHLGYCPHGGELQVSSTTFEDIPPHRFCSRQRNYSHRVNLQPGVSVVRDAVVNPHAGDLDDLGYTKLLQQISERAMALERSMHYPTQLAIRGQISALEAQAHSLSKTNSVWRRRWPMRLCTSEALAGRYYLTLWGDTSMDPRAHSGTFTVRFTREQFSRSQLSDRLPRRGCLRRGGTESFVLPTSPLRPELTSLGFAEARGFYVDAANNHVSTMTVRRGSPPTATEYDAAVAHPSLRVAMSACDVAAPQQWHFQLSLSPDHTVSEVFFELAVELEDATRELGETVTGYVCCGQYKYYAFPGLDERIAPTAAFNLTSGRVKALYWRYGSCPREAEHVKGGVCQGWCVLDWYRLFSGNLGRANYLSSSTLPVPFGLGDEPDKRRGGTWYLGVQALDDELASYSLTTDYRAPSVDHKEGCDRLDRYCNMPDRYKDVEQSAAAARHGALVSSWRRSALMLLCTGVAVVLAASQAEETSTRRGHGRGAQGRAHGQ
jgi:hypothetical protein